MDKRACALPEFLNTEFCFRVVEWATLTCREFLDREAMPTITSNALAKNAAAFLLLVHPNHQRRHP